MATYESEGKQPAKIRRVVCQQKWVLSAEGWGQQHQPQWKTKEWEDWNRRTGMESAMDCMLCPPRSIGWPQVFKVMVLEVGPSGRWWGYEIRVFMMESVASKRPQRALSPFQLWKDTERRHLLWTRKETLTRHRICLGLKLRLPASRNVRNKSLFFVSHPAYSMFLWQHKQTKTETNIILRILLWNCSTAKKKVEDWD